jgi:hypothetical protein
MRLGRTGTVREYDRCACVVRTVEEGRRPRLTYGYDEALGAHYDSLYITTARRP